MKLAELKQVTPVEKTLFPNRAILEKSIASKSIEVPKEVLVSFEAFDKWMLSNSIVK